MLLRLNVSKCCTKPLDQKLLAELKVGALTLHIPNFATSDSQILFIPVELKFENCRISSDINYCRWVVFSLHSDGALQVLDDTIYSSNKKGLGISLQIGMPFTKISVSSSSFTCFSMEVGGLHSHFQKCGVLGTQLSLKTRPLGSCGCTFFCNVPVSHSAAHVLRQNKLPTTPCCATSSLSQHWVRSRSAESHPHLHRNI